MKDVVKNRLFARRKRVVQVLDSARGNRLLGLDVIQASSSVVLRSPLLWCYLHVR
jgi:hypothetical protein